MSRVSTFALVLMASAALVAQETTPAPKQAEPQQIDSDALLQKAIQKMASLHSLCFQTTETQDAASTRQILKQMAGLGAGAVLGGGDKVVRGAFSDGILHAKMNDGNDEAVLYRGRMVARSDSSWKLRRNRLHGGAPMPFILDPQLFFEALGQVPRSSITVRKVDHQETTQGKRVVLSLSLTGDAANDFGLAGTLPPVAKGFGGMAMKLGGMGGDAKEPDLTIDLALTVDPATALVHRVRSATYQEGGLPGGGRVMVGGAGFGEEEEEEEEKEEDKEEVKTRDAQGNRIYKRGLPIRKLKDSLSRMEFDISFTKHGQPYVFELDAAGRKLLRLPATQTNK